MDKLKSLIAAGRNDLLTARFKDSDRPACYGGVAVSLDC